MIPGVTDGSGDVRDLLAATICLLAFALLVWRLPLLWRNEIGWESDRPPKWWFLGEAAWRACARLPPVGLAASLTGGAYVMSVYLGVAEGLRYALVVPPAIVMVLGWSVFLFNRPKAIVAPHHRAQPGALQEWLGASAPQTPPPQRPTRLG